MNRLGKRADKSRNKAGRLLGTFELVNSEL
jgi:hypothetical protein